MNNIDCKITEIDKTKRTNVKATSAEIVVLMINDKPYYEIKYFDVSDKKCHIGYGSYILEFVVEWLKECFEIVPENVYTKENSDNILYAVKCLDEFTHNYCMNCAETKTKGELIFRCFDGCPFNYKRSGKCLIKSFAADNAPEYKDFGCMS